MTTKTNRISIMGMDKQDVLNLLRDEVGKRLYANSDGGIEIYADYRDALDEKTLFDIVSSDNPREALYEIITEYEQSFYPDIEIDVNYLLRDLLDSESYDYIIDSDIVTELCESYYFYYDLDYFLNQSIRMNILIDSDNWNYDCTCDNALNRYGCGEIDDNSSVLWLCKQLGKEQELLDAIKRYNENSEKCEDCFIQSCIEEFEEQYSSTSTLTFLVETTLKDAMKLLEIQKEESKGYVEYYPSKSKGDSYLILNKSTMCGLFDPIHGGGSLLEIELPTDIKLPIKNCCFEFEGSTSYNGNYGYTVDSVYGLVSSCWKDNIKEIYDGTTQATK